MIQVEFLSLMNTFGLRISREIVRLNGFYLLRKIITQNKLEGQRTLCIGVCLRQTEKKMIFLSELSLQYKILVQVFSRKRVDFRIAIFGLRKKAGSTKFQPGTNCVRGVPNRVW